MDWLTAAVTIVTQGWPIAAIAVAVLFRKDLAALIPRLRKAGPLELDAEEQKQVLASPETPNLPRLLPGVANTPAIVAAEKAVRHGLESFPQEQRLDYLARALAEANLAVRFERIYRMIFGSQIAALKFLNANPNVDSAPLRHFYEGAKRAFPDIYGDYSFEQWGTYLTIVGLALEQDGRWQITDNGIEFLRYLVNVGLPESKAA